MLRNCKPGDKDYPRHEILRDVATIGFNFNADQIIGTTCDASFCDDDNEPITNETFYSKYLLKACIGLRSIAIENVSLGLTLKDEASLDENFPITTIFSVMPSTALDVIVFADDGYESAEDVIDFLTPKYCKEVLVINQTGSPDYQKLEAEIIESQKIFFEKTLPNLLRDLHKAEKTDKEMYKELTRKRKDFLSVRQTMPLFWGSVSCLIYLKLFLLSSPPIPIAFRPLCDRDAAPAQPRFDGGEG